MRWWRSSGIQPLGSCESGGNILLGFVVSQRFSGDAGVKITERGLPGLHVGF
jgi:hypothetical protein